MKKYSSYANLKLGNNNKAYPVQIWPNKLTNTPSSRKIADAPIMVITKQPYAIPMTTKYSAGYLQRQKMFSSKKQNKDVINTNLTNVKPSTPLNNNNYIYDNKLAYVNRTNNSKSKKNLEQKQRSIKKEKLSRFQKNLDIENKQNYLYTGKAIRLEVQSPKGLVNKKIEQKGQKPKVKVQQKLMQKAVRPTTSGPVLKPKQKQKQKKQKEEQGLKDYVTKYQPQQKSILLLHCTSQSNLLKMPNIQQKTGIKGYYKSAVYNAFYSSKNSSFNQICKNHLATSIDFLTYAHRNPHIIPSITQKCSLPPSNKKTIIFDLDQTLIHCNQSLDMPHDVALEITFPNGSKIKAGINVRPYATECLKELSRYFEIVVFTASHQCYANVIIDYLDPNRQFVSHRFFRQTCHKTQQGFYVKDLRVFGRDLSNVLLVDNAAYSYCFQPQNGIPIVPFYNNKADLELKQITSYLKQFLQCKNMRSKNNQYMRLSEYHNYNCPKKLINQLYF